MEDWIQILVSFVNNDAHFNYGTKKIEEIKMATPHGTIEVKQDERWHELLRIGEVFAGNAS